MEKVLLAEDCPDLIDLYQRFLINSGFEVIHTDDGSKIEEIINQHEIHIIVSDTDLINADGDQICHKLLYQGKLQNTLIIAMSASRNNEHNWEGIAHDFLYKSGIVDLGKTVRTIYSRYIQNPSLKRYKEF